MQIKTRQQAAADKDKRYYTGKPCTNGHDVARYTSSGICVKCNADRTKEYQENIRRAVRGTMTRVCVQVHPADKEYIESTAKMLRDGRGLS